MPRKQLSQQSTILSWLLTWLTGRFHFFVYFFTYYFYDLFVCLFIYFVLFLSPPIHSLSLSLYLSVALSRSLFITHTHSLFPLLLSSLHIPVLLSMTVSLALRHSHVHHRYLLFRFFMTFLCHCLYSYFLSPLFFPYLIQLSVTHSHPILPPPFSSSLSLSVPHPRHEQFLKTIEHHIQKRSFELQTQNQ